MFAGVLVNCFSLLIFEGSLKDDSQQQVSFGLYSCTIVYIMLNKIPLFNLFIINL